VFVDATSGYVHIEHKVTLNASDSINAKSDFKRTSKDVGMHVLGYHTDNDIYTYKAHAENLAENQQSIRHSGVGAK
jgi:hypothetical protein